MEDQEWGRNDFTESEKRRVEEDDILMLRMVMLFIVAEEVRKANSIKMPTQFRPGTASRAKRRGDGQLVENPHLEDAGRWSRSMASKSPRSTSGIGKEEPTSPPRLEVEGSTENPTKERRETEGKTPEELLRETKQLARWAPGMMKALAEQVMEKVCGKKPQLRPLSWEEHVRANHTPFRRDCRICQEAMAKASPHRKAGHARAGVLSLDLTGPFKKAKTSSRALRPSSCGSESTRGLIHAPVVIQPRTKRRWRFQMRRPDFQEPAPPEGKKARGRPRKDELAEKKEEERLKWKAKEGAKRAEEEARRREEAPLPRGEPIEGGIFNDTDEEEAARVPAEEDQEEAAREPAGRPRRRSPRWAARGRGKTRRR